MRSMSVTWMPTWLKAREKDMAATPLGGYAQYTFAIRHSPFAIRHSPFAIRYLPSLRLDAGKLHHFAPLLQLRAHVGEELLGAGRRRHGAVGEHAVDDVLLVEDRDDLLVEPRDDVLRHVGRPDHAAPRGAFVAGHTGFRDRRKIGQRRQAFRVA